MRKDVKMYYDLRVYLSPMQSYELVQERYPRIQYSMMDLETMKLKRRFKVRYL